MAHGIPLAFASGRGGASRSSRFGLRIGASPLCAGRCVCGRRGCRLRCTRGRLGRSGGIRAARHPVRPGSRVRNAGLHIRSRRAVGRRARDRLRRSLARRSGRSRVDRSVGRRGTGGGRPRLRTVADPRCGEAWGWPRRTDGLHRRTGREQQHSAQQRADEARGRRQGFRSKVHRRHSCNVVQFRKRRGRGASRDGHRRRERIADQIHC